MRLSYEEPVLKIIRFDCEDVISTSKITDIKNPRDSFLDANETLPIK